MTTTIDNTTATGNEKPASAKTKTLLVDTDVHPSFIIPRDIAPRLDEVHREHLKNLPPRSAGGGIPRMINNGFRADSREGGVQPGTDLALLQKQLLDEYSIDCGILIPFYVTPPGSPDFDVAFNHAVNVWQSEDWLDPEPRLLSSIRLPWEFPERAADEIRYWAGRDPRFVQVQVSENPEHEWGDRRYWPIYEAAAECGLPLMAHVGGTRAYNGSGPVSYYVEQHIYVQLIIERIVTSLITAGVFDAFPTLQFALIEACIAWAGPLQWAMDSLATQLPKDLSHLQRKPGEYFRDHFWFSTQPIEEPDEPRHLLEAFDMTAMEDRIMYSSDYPHWDFDSPLRTLPAGTPKDLREKIMGTNAQDLYRLASDGSLLAR